MTVETETDTTVDSQVDDSQTSQTEEADTSDGAESLGDAGKRALATERAQRKAALERAKTAEDRIAALEAQIAGKEAEHAAEQEKQRVKDEALSAANRRILSAELRAAAKGKLADPTDARLYIDLSEFDVSDDGEVDTDALTSAIDDLIARKPHLAAAGRRFNGDADGGATRQENRPRQLTQAELESMTPEQINTARKNGQLDKLLGRKP